MRVLLCPYRAGRWALKYADPEFRHDFDVVLMGACSPQARATTKGGEAHHARVVLPHGFEFSEAELASATFSAFGALKFNHQDRSAIFSRFAYGPEGIVN